MNIQPTTSTGKRNPRDVQGLKHYTTISIEEYASLMNLARSLSKKDEASVLVDIGYRSRTIASEWRKKNGAPAVCGFALRGLIAMLEAHRASPSTAAQPVLRFTAEQLELIALAVRNCAATKTFPLVEWQALLSAIYFDLALRLRGAAKRHIS